ncbi:MAG: hypothetical protein HZC10_03370 [Nitrospirae bacterium]|nr:hypothetical protein [Nitrospirota bacterium]
MSANEKEILKALKEIQDYLDKNKFVAVLILILFIYLAILTTSKLYRMCIIKGWIDGEMVIRTYTITQKWHERYATDYGTGHMYWISWTGQNIKENGVHRVSMQYEKWVYLQINDPIEIIYIVNNPSPYSRDGMFVSDGNFIFDIVLLSLELIAILFLSRSILKLRKERRLSI